MIKMKMKIKNRSHIYDINRPRSSRGHKYSKYKNCLSDYDDASIHEVQFTKKLSNTEAELKKSVAYKKTVYLTSGLTSEFKSLSFI